VSVYVIVSSSRSRRSRRLSDSRIEPADLEVATARQNASGDAGQLAGECDRQIDPTFASGSMGS
jgi:hypothetical protein